jgi:hypothetical protein
MNTNNSNSMTTLHTQQTIATTGRMKFPASSLAAAR